VLFNVQAPNTWHYLGVLKVNYTDKDIVSPSATGLIASKPTKEEVSGLCADD
jgi:hypothetical protein